MEKTIRRRWEKLCYHPVSIQRGGANRENPSPFTNRRKTGTSCDAGRPGIRKGKRMTGNGEEGQGKRIRVSLLMQTTPPGFSWYRRNDDGEMTRQERRNTQKNRRKENRTNASEKVRIPGVWRKVRD
jgi:hypothetical protein